MGWSAYKDTAFPACCVVQHLSRPTSGIRTRASGIYTEGVIPHTRLPWTHPSAARSPRSSTNRSHNITTSYHNPPSATFLSRRISPPINFRRTTWTTALAQPHRASTTLRNNPDSTRPLHCNTTRSAPTNPHRCLNKPPSTTNNTTIPRPCHHEERNRSIMMAMRTMTPA